LVLNILACLILANLGSVAHRYSKSPSLGILTLHIRVGYNPLVGGETRPRLCQNTSLLILFTRFDLFNHAAPRFTI
jgi:hypothetical protein